MTRNYTEEQAVAAIARLTRSRLQSFVETRCVVPLRAGHGLAFSEADLARLELMCELADEFELDEDALGLVMSLIDQLHGLRRELRTLAEAVETEPAEVRERIRTVYRQASRG